MSPQQGIAWPPGTHTGPGKAFMGHFSLDSGLGLLTCEGSPPKNRSVEGAPRHLFSVLPHSFQGEWSGHHLPVELEPDVGRPGQPVHSGCGGPGTAAVVLYQASLLLTQHLSW